MRFLLLPVIAALPFVALQAAEKKKLTASQILDEVIARPGDFDQMCDAPPPVPFAAPPIPAFGLSVAQELFMSDEMKALLRGRREDMVKELEARFKNYDWLNPPPAPPVSKKALFVKKEPGNEEFDPTKPSGANPRAMGGIMLTIIEDLDAVELLPELLKLEQDLHTITTAALKDKKAPVPTLELGGGAMWQGMMEEFKDVEDWDKAPPELKHKKQLFEALVFDRQMLGVMLQLLQHQNYAPLKDSTPALLRAMAIKRKPLDEDFAKIKRAEDIPENDRRYVFFDKDLGVPVWRYEHADMIYSEPLREEVRALAQGFVSGNSPPTITGENLVSEALLEPGGYAQMCMSPSPISFDAPIPAYGPLAPRHFFLNSQNLQRLQAHRQKVVPVLVERLRALDLQKPVSKDLRIGILLAMVRELHAIETLPELLRIEQQADEVLVGAEKDDKTALPDLDLDTPVTWVGAKDEGKPDKPRKAAVFTLRLFQRELLGLMGNLLRDEEFQPYFATGVERAYEAGLRKLALEGELKEITKEEDFPYEKRDKIVWNKKLGIPEYIHHAPVEVPYTEALREEVHAMAQEFLKTVPPEKWKGMEVMKLVANVVE